MNKQHKEMVSADNAEELLSRLKAIDISVPGRIEGRTKEHTEQYSICRLLSTLAQTEYMSYPVSLKKRERPDFLLYCAEPHIGIEITEATSKDYSAYLALAERERPEHFIESSHFRYGTIKTLQEKRKLLSQDKLTSDGWCGDGAENEWALFMKDAITLKCKKLAEPTFQKFEQNWLLIYDNTPGPIFDRQDLEPYIKSLWPNHTVKHFDKIFIESSWTEENSSTSQSRLIILSQDFITDVPIENIWRETSP